MSGDINTAVSLKIQSSDYSVELNDEAEIFLPHHLISIKMDHLRGLKDGDAYF